MPAKKSIAGEIFQSEPCCLDTESGLFTSAHFRSVLVQELARLDRWEKPLGLVILKFSGLDREEWEGLGRLVRDSLRCIDLAARLNRDRIAVLMPEADLSRLRRWLREFLVELQRSGSFSDLILEHGKAVARPWEGLGADELVALASADMGGDDLDDWSNGGEAVSDGEAATAIAADERNLLFAGFKTLGAE